jgi:branched-chain amino acid transport system permease protein
MQQIVNAVSAGSIYALFALGFTLVFGVLDRLNLAHAAVYTAGAFIGIELVGDAGLAIWIAVPLVFVAGSLLGVAIDRAAFTPLGNRPDAHFGGMIASIAVGAMIVALLQQRYGAETRRFPPGTFPSRRFEIGGVTITLLQVVIIGCSLVLTLALALLVRRTGLGRAMRAVAENPHAAKILGVNTSVVTATTFALSSGLGAVAGVLYALNTSSAQLGMGSSIELKGLAVIIVGGMGSILGALVGGMIVGLAEVLTITHVGSTWRDVVTFALLVAILLVRPQGLFGTRRVREV